MERDPWAIVDDAPVAPAAPANDPWAAVDEAPASARPGPRISAPMRQPNEPGNIDLDNRPRVDNGDGTFSTVRSMSFQDDDGREVLIPMISDGGQLLDKDQAIALYRETGKHLGKFASPREANTYAQRLHNEQAQRYAEPQPPSASSSAPTWGGALNLNRPAPGSGVLAAAPVTEENIGKYLGPRDEKPRVSAPLSPEQEANIEGKYSALDKSLPAVGSTADFANALMPYRRLGPRLSEGPLGHKMMPEIEVTAARQKAPVDYRPLATLGETVSAIPGTVAGRYEMKWEGAKEIVASQDARKKYWQASVLPDAFDLYLKNKGAATDGDPFEGIPENPMVQEAARRAGTSVEDFVSPLYDVLKMRSEGTLENFKEANRAQIVPQDAYLEGLAKDRQDIAAELQRIRPHFASDWSGKALLFDSVNSLVADMAPALAAGFVAGPEAGLATMGGLVMPEQYADLRNQGLSDPAALFGSLAQTAAEVAPEGGVLEVALKTAAGKEMLRNVIGKWAEGKVGHIAGVTMAEAGSEDITELIDIGLDMGLFDKTVTLADALDRLARSGVIGGLMGGGTGVFTSPIAEPHLSGSQFESDTTGPLDVPAFDAALQGEPDPLPPAGTADLADVFAGVKPQGFAAPTLPQQSDVQQQLPINKGPEPTISSFDIFDKPAITGSRAPETAGHVGTAPSITADQGTATPPGEQPAPPVPAAAPAPPAPTEPAPTPAPQAEPAVSTTQEPPAGAAAPPIAEQRPEATASLAALKADPNAHVLRHEPDPRGGLTTPDKLPPFKTVAPGVAIRQYVNEVDGERYPVQEMRLSGSMKIGSDKRYTRGYDKEGKPFNNVPHNLEETFDLHFPAPATAPAAAPAPVAPAPTPPPAPTPITKGKKAAKAPAAPAAAPAVPAAVQGLKTGKREAVTTAAGRKVDTEFEVVDAADLVTSDNTAFPQDLQPRERGERMVSQEQVAKLAGTIDPTLLGSNTHAEHGAPIIGKDDNLVESGNGRVMALRQMYGRNAEAAEKYRAFVAEQSGQDVSGMKAPILVRRRVTDMSHAERQAFTKEANKSSVAKMSAGEQAKLDQEALTPLVMSKLPDEMGEDFNLAKASGAPFVEAFVAHFPAAERGDLVEADGKPSANAVRRATAALLTKAFGGTRAGEAAIRRASEEKGGDTQTLVKTLIRFAPAFAQLKDDIAAGRVQDQADIGGQIAEALEVVRSAGSAADITNWFKHEDLLNQKDETVKQLVQAFYQFDGRGVAKRMSTAKTIADTLSEYLRVARQHAPEQAGGGLFGDEGAAPVLNPAAELGKLNVARQAKELTREREETAQKRAQGGLFTASGQPSAAVSARPRDEGSGQEEQPAGPRESGDASRFEAQKTGDETDFLDESADELRRKEQRQSKAQPGPYSMTREGEIRASPHEQIWTENGLDADLMEAAPPHVRYARAVEIIKKKFGFRSIAKDAYLNSQDAIDALKDAYVGLTNLAAVQNINPEVLSLNGRLALEFKRSKAGALAYYDPKNKTIGMVRRNDAFAHEWAHALDHWLVETYAPEMLAKQGRHLTGKTRAGGVAETMDDQVREAYIDVLNNMFFDGAKAALYVADLEQKIATAKTDKQRARIQKQLDNFRAGHSKKGGIESAYYEAAKAHDEAGPEGGAGEGYWQRPTEMFARAFEAYIANKIGGYPADHPFVTQSERMYNEGRIGTMKVPYPKMLDRTNIFSSIDTLMRAARDRGLVATGNAPAAIQPTDTRYWRTLAPAMSQAVARQARSVLARLKEPFARQLAEVHRADREMREHDKQDQSIRDVTLNKSGLSGRRRWVANQGLKAIEIGKAVPQMLAHSIRGMLLGLEDLHKGNKGIAWLRSRFATDPGSGRFTGAVYTDEVRSKDKVYQGRFSAIVKKHDIRGFDDAELKQLRDVLVNAVPADSVDPKIAAAAADMRRFLNDMYVYNVSNGVNIGYAKNGYLPRIMDSLLVENDLDGFRRQAQALYSRVYPKEIGTLEEVLADPARLANIVQHVKEITKNGKVFSAKQLAAALLDDAKQLEKAMAQLEAAQENGDDTTDIEEEIAQLGEAVYNGLREPWSIEAAADWEDRIRFGGEPEFAHERRGPDGKYTKSRVLPVETDTIMADYMKTDPLELISTYVSQSVRRVEFGKFFGNPEGGQKLGWKLDAAMHAARMPYKAADGSTQQVRDDEFEELQKSIELLIGRYNTNMTKRGIRWRQKFTCLFTPVVLARSLKSQIAEPNVLSAKTGNITDGFRVYYKQMQDLAAKLGIKGAKEQAEWRKEMSEYFGVVADHMTDQLMLMRYNLMDLNSSDRVKMARFFQVIGVHPHAMSMRRAAAEIFMTRYAPKLAARVAEGGPSGKLAREALAELGLDANNDELLKELAGLGEIKDVVGLDALKHIDQIRTAINRFVDQGVQNPSAIDKPRLASMPEYSLMYGILSFQFAYQRNVLIATTKELVNAWKTDKTLGAIATLNAATSLSLVAGGQLAMWVAGMALFGDDDWDDIEKKLNEKQGYLPAWLWQSASRSGMFGAADPVINAFLGLKYERDLSQITAGPLLQVPLGTIQAASRLFIGNSENNPNAEYRATEALWNGAFAPFITSQALKFAGASGPVGAALDVALGVGIPYLTSKKATGKVAKTAAEITTGQKYIKGGGSPGIFGGKRP